MRRRLFGVAVLLVASGASAYAECVPPPPLADVTTKVDTEGAVAKVLKIAGINLKVDIEVERKSIFTQFPNANQMVVALIAIYQYCTQLETVKTLTGEQKLEKLAAYQTTWLMAAVGPQAIATTADKKTVPRPTGRAATTNGPIGCSTTFRCCASPWMTRPWSELKPERFPGPTFI
jgi:hypothetical protein